MPASYPMLYQINTRVWLTDLGAELDRPATLDDAPDAQLDDLEKAGFDWVWLLGVWKTGDAGREISRNHPSWQDAFRRALPDLSPRDICGSCFAIQDYAVSDRLGGANALARFRDRLRQRGIKLMLDFVPNHMAPDHPWVDAHPSHFIQGSEQAARDEPGNYVRLQSGQQSIIFAHGRDPYFPGWPDTVQLDYGNPDVHTAMQTELMRIAKHCDGLRCDMAMLILPDIFQQTWGRTASPFWPTAIASVRREHPDFVFMAEVYWDKEWELQQQGFDYAYDKRLYDRLRERSAGTIRDHLVADLNYQNKLARFLENHDEARAGATFPDTVHQAAAILTYFAPGLRFFHQGQFTGCKVHVPPHLCRAPKEPENASIKAFYDRLLASLQSTPARAGDWRTVDCLPAWEGNDSVEGIIAYAIEAADGDRLIIIVNYSPIPAQCRLLFPLEDAGGRLLRLKDLMSGAVYERDGDELRSPGLYIDLPAWGYHVFQPDGDA